MRDIDNYKLADGPNLLEASLMSNTPTHLVYVILLVFASWGCGKNAQHPDIKPSGVAKNSQQTTQINESTETKTDSTREGNPRHETELAASSDADPALLTYLDYLLTEPPVTQFMQGLGGGGRTTSNKSDILWRGSVVHLDRTYSYDANGVGTITDKSKSSSSKADAVTFQNDLHETIDQRGRPLSIHGTVILSNEQTIEIDRTYQYDPNGMATVTDKSTVTQDKAPVRSYKVNLIETINQLGKSLSVEGTLTASDGRVLKARRN